MAIGDALGATVEFMTVREIAASYKVHNQIIGGGWLHLKPGQVTDDTGMALALGRAIIADTGWNLKGVADSFVAWMRNRPVDIGHTCRFGIRQYLLTGNLSMPPNSESAGNGAAMRNLPVILSSYRDEDEMIRHSIEQAHITHNNEESDAAIVALARMTRALLLQGPHAPCNRIAAELVASHPQFKFKPWPGRTSGYIVDTVQTVLDGFFNTGSFEDCLVRVVNRGGDADTAGALAGQLSGALFGIDGIPPRWLKRLDPKITNLIYKQVPKLLHVPQSSPLFAMEVTKTCCFESQTSSAQTL